MPVAPPGWEDLITFDDDADHPKGCTPVRAYYPGDQMWLVTGAYGNPTPLGTYEIEIGVGSCTETIEIEVVSVLPIQWLKPPIVSQIGEKSIISWETMSEFINKEFIIQYSSDGINFNKVGLVKASDNTNEIQEFEFIHKNPTPGMNYYRIKQVDFDGKYSYSDVVSVYF